MRHLYMIICVFAAGLGFLASPVQAAKPEKYHDGLWKNSYCTNPGVPRAVKKAPFEVEIEAIFDITSAGVPENVRITKFITENEENQRHSKGYERELGKALKRWEYFAFIENSEESPRHDVILTFKYLQPTGGESKKPQKDSCTTSFLPPLPSSAGNPANPLVNIQSCSTPLFPRQRKFAKKSANVLLNFDINGAGKVIQARLSKSQEDTFFSQSALRSLRSWRYFPYFNAGVPQARENIAISFYFGQLPESIEHHKCTATPSGYYPRTPKTKLKRIRCDRDDTLPSKACKRLRGEK